MPLQITGTSWLSHFTGRVQLHSSSISESLYKMTSPCHVTSRDVLSLAMCDCPGGMLCGRCVYFPQCLTSLSLSRYAARFDCGCRYELCVRLLSANYIVLHEFCPKPVVIEQWSDAEWREVRNPGSSCAGSSFRSVLWF